jgi:hypothetical protein
MRPEFLLNYIALSPNKKAVSESYRAIFPTILGIRLSHRLNPHDLARTLEEVRKAYEVDEYRARAMISELCDKLKSDQLRQYEVAWDTTELTEELLME